MELDRESIQNALELLQLAMDKNAFGVAHNLAMDTIIDLEVYLEEHPE